MKKIIFFLLTLIALSGTACSNEHTPISVDQLPQTAQQFIKTYFSDCTISLIEKDGHEYDVHFANGYEIDFDKNGEWESIDCQINPIPNGIVPAAINNYIQNNYPQTFIVEISRDRHGYDVELNNHMELEFNQNGEFLRID